MSFWGRQREEDERKYWNLIKELTEKLKIAAEAAERETVLPRCYAEDIGLLLEKAKGVLSEQN